MPWSSGLCDLSAQPGGCKLFCYAWCCGCCAAGDVAHEAGNSYCMACVCPFLVPFIGLCLRCDSRAKIAKKYNVSEPNNTTGCSACLTICCLDACALRQELSHIAKAKGGAGGKPISSDTGAAK
jgi:Cys-rich protein (TIGR01571 family)